MMRDILFRGAQKVDGAKSLIWYEGSLVIEKDSYTGEKEYYIQNENGCFLVIPETVGQYTGLPDKNGKKIFEGEVVKLYDKPVDETHYAFVEFGNPNHQYHWGFQLHAISKHPFAVDILHWCDMEESGAFIEVIGNIYDNLELLEVK